MAIFEPKIVPKKVGTRQGAAEHGAEVYPLHEDDFNHNFEVDYFKIKLGYNGIHHYFPIIRWFKFTLKPPYRIAIGNFFSAIWDTSHWNFLVKFGLKTA